MRDRRPIRPRCFLTALILAWAAAVFLPSAVIAIAGISDVAADRSLPVRIFEVADEMSPAAKIGFVLLLAPLLVAARRAPVAGAAAIAADLAAAAAAMLLMLALLPAEWSRGFGIGIAGARFAPVLVGIYLSGALAAALTFAGLERRCLARHQSA